MKVRITPWSGAAAPTEEALRELLRADDLSWYTWANGSFDPYAAHSHDYNKVIYVVSGAITFGLPNQGREIQLKAGDRLDLPAGTVHDAVAGDQGVVCLEAHY